MSEVALYHHEWSEPHLQGSLTYDKKMRLPWTLQWPYDLFGPSGGPRVWARYPCIRVFPSSMLVRGTSLEIEIHHVETVETEAWIGTNTAKKQQSPLGPPQGPRRSPTVGSYGGAVSY